MSRAMLRPQIRSEISNVIVVFLRASFFCCYCLIWKMHCLVRWYSHGGSPPLYDLDNSTLYCMCEYVGHWRTTIIVWHLRIQQKLLQLRVNLIETAYSFYVQALCSSTSVSGFNPYRRLSKILHSLRTKRN